MKVSCEKMDFWGGVCLHFLPLLLPLYMRINTDFLVMSLLWHHTETFINLIALHGLDSDTSQKR